MFIEPGFENVKGGEGGYTELQWTISFLVPIFSFWKY